jgi:PAS domain S-box-containing protein
MGNGKERSAGAHLAVGGGVAVGQDRVLSGATLQLLLDAAPDGIVVVARDGRIVFANAQTETLFGYPRGELLGLPVEVLVPERFRAAHPGKRESYFTDPRPRPMGAGLELFGRRKDGSEFPAEISLAPMSTEGEFLVTAAIRDATERRKVEAKFRGLLEAAPDGMVIVDGDGRIVLVNAQTEKLFGYAREELLGQSVEMLVPARFHGAHRADRSRYFLHPTVRAMRSGLDLFGLRKDGSEFPAEISLSPLVTDEGTLVTSAIRDITERRRNEEAVLRAKQAAEASSRELEAFSYSVAHDLRAPLRSLDGFSKALLEDYEDKLAEDGRQSLKFIRQSAQQMAELIDDLLNLSRVTRSDLRREDVDLGALAQVTIARLRRSDPARGVDFVVADGLAGNADPHLLGVLLENLIGNAWKFTAKQPNARIELGLTRDDGRPVYFVRDNGAGFDMRYVDKLFGIFERLHAASDFEGTGIGLATVQRIVQRHGGRAWAEGAVGQGATFYFTLDEERRQ